jgi:hypothetical protein
MERKPMKVIGKLEFPQTPAEGADWKRPVFVRALARKVLVVARPRVEGAWCAYIDAVPGERHEAEKWGVLENGDKLPSEVARVLFPMFDGVPYSE